MFFFSKKKESWKMTTQENEEIEKAKNYLYSIHPVSRLFFGREPYHYLTTSYNNEYVRYHFYKGTDKRLEYIVLTDEERVQKEKEFQEQMGTEYWYLDTIFCEIYGDDVQHRFIGLNGERAYLTDKGEVGEGYLMKD